MLLLSGGERRLLRSIYLWRFAALSRCLYSSRKSYEEYCRSIHEKLSFREQVQANIQRKRDESLQKNNNSFPSGTYSRINANDNNEEEDKHGDADGHTKTAIKSKSLVIDNPLSLRPLKNVASIPGGLSDSLSKEPFSICNLTLFQDNILSRLGENCHVLVKSDTGSGKSLFILVYILSRLEKGHHTARKDAHALKYCKPRWLIILPNPQLVSQFMYWTEILAKDPGAFLHVFNVSVGSPSRASYEDVSLVIGTPKDLCFALDQEMWTPKGLEGIFIDEVEFLLQPLSRYSSREKINQRARKPPPSLILLKAIIDLVRDVRVGASPVPQIVASSATLNTLVKREFAKLGFFDATINQGRRLVVLSPKIDDQTSVDNKEGQSIAKGDGTCSDDDQDCFLPELPLSYSNPVRHFARVTCEEVNFDDGTHGYSEMDAESIATLVLDMWADYDYSNSILFVSSSDSKARWKGLLEMAKTQTEEPSLSFRYISEWCPSRDKGTANTLYITSDVDARGVDMPPLSAVFIVGKIESAMAYMHMAGRVGRYNSILSSKRSYDVVSILSKGQISKFKRDLFMAHSPIRLYRWKPPQQPEMKAAIS